MGTAGRRSCLATVALTMRSFLATHLQGDVAEEDVSLQALGIFGLLLDDGGGGLDLGSREGVQGGGS